MNFALLAPILRRALWRFPPVCVRQDKTNRLRYRSRANILYLDRFIEIQKYIVFAVFNMSFSLPKLINIVSTIDDVLSVRQSPSTINASTGYEEEENDAEFINFTFYLNHGILHSKFFNYTCIVTYENKTGEILNSIEFRESSELKDLQKFVRKIRTFDRHQPSTAKPTTIDRASFGLTSDN